MTIRLLRSAVLIMLATLSLLFSHCQAAVALFDYDPQLPLDIQEVSSRSENGLIIYDLSYASPMGGRVPAYLVKPDRVDTFAGVLMQHGMGGSRDDVLSWAQDLAQTGAVVLAISAPFSRPENRDRERWPITFTEQDRTEQIQLIIDLRRGVDLLAQRPDVDADRLAYVGYSYGGAMGGVLAGVEQRLKAYGLMVAGGGAVAFFTDGAERLGELAQLPPAEQARWLAWMEPLEPNHFVRHAAPAALFFQNARQDQVVDYEDVVAFQEAGSEPKRVQWYDSDHQLPPQATRDQANWLADYIGINAANFGIPPDSALEREGARI